MLTVVETPIFKADADELWSTEERLEFVTFIANNPEAGDVYPGTGGCRKIRWSRPGMGKRGGVRVVYYNRLDNGVIWLLAIYAKAEIGNIPPKILRQIREAL